MRPVSPLLAVYVGVIFVVLCLPLVLVVVISFDSATHIKFPPEGYDLHWYRRVFANEGFLLAIENTLIVAAASTAIAVALGLPAALVIARQRFPGRDLVYTLLLSSLTVPWIVFGLALLFLWSAAGLRLSLATLIFGHTVIAAPYVVRTCAAVLASTAPSYEQAARTLGANRTKAFFLVTLPMMKPAILASAAFAFVISVINIPVALFVTTADNVTLPVAIFSYMANDFDPGVAALSVVQLLFIFAALALASRAARIDRLGPR